MTDRIALRRVLAVPLAFAALKLALQAAAITNYGYFRDELYYIACSKHLAWGYVDQPPLSIAILAAVRAVAGESLIALRALPALAGAATIVVIGLIVADLGGRRFAQALACLCGVLPPVWLAVDHFFSMNTFDTLVWSVAFLLLLRALDGARPRTWIALGVVVGLGLLNKTSMLWFAGATALGLVATGHRRVLRTPWPWAAGTIAAVLFLPHLVWQVRNGWPTLEFMRVASTQKMIRTGLLAFWAQQAFVMSPATLPIWLTGLGSLLAARRTRVLGLVFLLTAVLLVASGSSRPNYLAVAYAPLFAAGAVAIERATEDRRRWGRVAALSFVLILGVPLVPAWLPALGVDRLIAYASAISPRLPAQERTREGDLPQVFADMFGWEELVARVARVYGALPPEDRAKCAILADNYGEAGAIDFFGPRYGLPPAISNHNNYWLWGPGGATGDVMILVGGSANDRHSDFQSVELADRAWCTHCMPFENGAPIFVCRGLNQPLARRWDEIRSYR